MADIFVSVDCWLVSLNLWKLIDVAVQNQMPDKVGTACHVGAFCFLIEDIFFIFAEMDYNPVFSGTVFISVFVHFLVLSGYSCCFWFLQCRFWHVFWSKNARAGFAGRCCVFAFKGVRGICPLQAKTVVFPRVEGRAFDRLRIYAGSACYSCANCPQGVCVLCELRQASYNT